MTTKEFNNLTKGNFAERLKQTKLATKGDIVDFVKETYFDWELMNINSKVTSNKTKHVEAEKKLSNYITSYIKLINNLTRS